MFFIVSKIFGFFALPSNLLMAIGLIGLALLLTRFRRLASWLIVTSLVLIAVAGWSPLGNALILPLEQRFPPWDSSRGAPDGIVILGGAITEDVSAARGAVALNEAAERLTVGAELARRYPDARIVFSGGNNALIFDGVPEAAFAVEELQALGVAHERITADEQSRNTIENAVFSRLIANPKPGERWLLVTSAYHMPRAIAAFRAAGFAVEAYPVDWRTRGAMDAVRPSASLGDGLRRTDTAVREWVGLVAYRLAGKTAEIVAGALTALPMQSPAAAPCLRESGMLILAIIRGRVSMGLHLAIANKNYSSWSFRPWLPMKVAGIPFEETLISLDAADFKSRLAALSGAGKVPVLIDGATRVWESLAILEYLAEKMPGAALWPNDPAARAHARAIAAEMHAGFLPLRRQLPMNVRRPIMPRALDADAAADVARIDTIWSECRARFGSGGPYLYGAFTASDAMYAPVVWRFHTYAVAVNAAASAYMRALMALPAWNEWRAAAKQEPWVLPHDEVDWPDVKRE